MADEVDKQPLSEQIVDILFERSAFEDAPLTEKILAEQLGKGRSQIRDALNRLEAEGLVERRKKKGVYITSPTAKVISDVYDVRTLLEGYAARLAADSASEAQLDELQKYSDQFEEAVASKDYSAMEHANTNFHQTLVHISRNELLMSMMKRMNFVRKAFQYAYRLEPTRQQIGSEYAHDRIVASLRQRNPDEAEWLVKNHVQTAKERVLEQALGFRMKGI